MILANGARAIVDARLKGLRPAEMVIVSLIGKTQEPNITVYANPKAAYDWRWVMDLQICIYANKSVDWQPTARAIATRKPQWLGLWDVDGFEGTQVYALPHVDDIEKPMGEWRHVLHFIPWLKFQNEKFAWGE